MLGWAAHIRSRLFIEDFCIIRAYKAVHYEQSTSRREEEQEVPLVDIKWRKSVERRVLHDWPVCSNCIMHVELVR